MEGRLDSTADIPILCPSPEPTMGVSRAVRSAASRARGVYAINAIVTTQLSPEQVVVNLNIDFDNSYDVRVLEAVILELENSVRTSHPQVYAVFVRPQSAESYNIGRVRKTTPAPYQSYF